jgi:asparagine synthase (glutamine-hydrolysing)
VEQNVAELRDRLGAVVAEQLMGDVPAGTFFSGGIDSCAVASFAARAGMELPCFGVHFTGQGVVDERPYQESAARAMGLDLHLVTLDGAEFPDDLRRLIYYQDQPVIGHAMFPMDRVSRLASEHVKVCLGGQGADEVFGGYARFALAHPWHVARSMFSRGGRSRASTAPQAAGPVGGNLWKQLVVGRNLRRLASNVAHLADWQGRYFENFAVVPERSWQRLFEAPEMVSRADCRELFQETVARSPAGDPAGKAMHWDMQTFLTGLFHQDDRISMSWSLESRVPFADPRLVEFAFRTPFDLKFRNGASKWLLRQAVADVLPAEVLNRRKVGFDTPASRWMKGEHAGFLRELLLSSAARSRGLWNPAEMEKVLDQAGHPLWFDVVWKASAIEMWARLFLDGEAVHSPPENPAAPSRNTPATVNRA